MKRVYLIVKFSESGKTFFQGFNNGNAVFGEESAAKVYENAGPGLPIHNDIKKIKKLEPGSHIAIHIP